MIDIVCVVFPLSGMVTVLISETLFFQEYVYSPTFSLSIKILTVAKGFVDVTSNQIFVVLPTAIPFFGCLIFTTTELSSSSNARVVQIVSGSLTTKPAKSFHHSLATPPELLPVPTLVANQFIISCKSI